MTPEPTALPSRRPRLRVSVRGLLLLIAAIGLALGLGQFWLANRDPERALISREIRTLADREAPAVARRAAIDAVENTRGRQARRTLKILTATLDDPDAGLRFDAVRAIGSVGRRLLADSSGVSADLVRPAATALVAALDDPDGAVRDASVEALGELHATATSLDVAIVDAEAALPPLLAILGTGHPEIGGEWSLGGWIRAQRLANQFVVADPDARICCYELAARGEDDRSRRGAILSLDVLVWPPGPPTAFTIPGRTGSDEELIRFLVERLRTNPPGDRQAIIRMLFKAGRRTPIGADQIESIAAEADDPDPEVRQALASLLLHHRALRAVERGDPAPAGR